MNNYEEDILMMIYDYIMLNKHGNIFNWSSKCVFLPQSVLPESVTSQECEGYNVNCCV